MSSPRPVKVTGAFKQVLTQRRSRKRPRPIHHDADGSEVALAGIRERFVSAGGVRSSNEPTSSENRPWGEVTAQCGDLYVNH
jgi:hypothetical protein